MPKTQSARRLRRSLNHLIRAQEREGSYIRLRWVSLWRQTVDRLCRGEEKLDKRRSGG